MAAVAGLRGTGDWATDERPKNFREMILWRNPNGATPITALTAKIQSESVDDPQFHWWDEPQDIVRLQVEGALASGDTTVVVDSSDPSDTSPDNRWGVAKHLVPGDLLLVEPLADAATYDNEIVEVVTVISDTQFVIKRGAAGTTPATIPDEGFLLLIGSTFAEGTAAPKSSSRNPIKYFNYTQIFKKTYEVTKTAAKTRTRTGDVLKNERKRKMFDHARDIEQSLLFGRRSEIVGENGKPQRTFGGIRSFINAKTTTIFSATITINTFLDAVYKVFDFESAAGDERIVFAGNEALNQMAKVIKGDTNSRINFTGQIKSYGMNFQEFVLPQGRLLIRSHPLLNRNTLYTKSMWLLDFSALRWRYLAGRDTHFEDNIQTKSEDVIKGQWLTEGGLEVRYGGLTLGYLGNVTQI